MDQSFKPNQELFAVYNSLGHLQDGVYFKEPDCNACLKDILRFMRTENQQTFATRRQLGQCNFLSTDLAPLVKQHCLNDNALFDYVLRLLSTLTTPPMLLFKEQIPDDIDSRKIYLDLQQHMFTYKSDLSIDVMFWSVIAKQMLKILQTDLDQRQDDDKVMLERMLVLIRNVLHVSSQDEEDVIFGEDNTHDKLLISMKKACLFDILIYICQNESEHEFVFYILEIYQSIFREQDPEILATLNNSLRLSEAEKRKDMEQLKEMGARTRSTSNALQNKFQRFKDSTYVVKNFKSIGNNDMICHKPISDISEMNLDQNKKIVRKAKNRRHFQDQSHNKQAHSSSLELKSYLRDLATSFISSSYNLLMKTARYYLERSKSQENDETYFIWAAHFFMKFNRFANAKVDFVMETLSKEYLHYLHCQIESHLDHIGTDKKNSKVWAKRLHNGIEGYKELIYTLAHVQSKFKTESSAISIANELKHKLFYDQDYRELLRTLIMVYDPIKMSDAYLNDLIEANHFFLKLLESYCRKNENELKVQQKKRRHKSKKNKKKDQKEDEIDEQPELIWTELAAEISNVLQGSDLPKIDENPELNVFDVLSEESKDEQKFEVMKKINLLLYTKRAEESVAVFREARNFFNDDCEDTFGSFDIELDEELLALQNILMNDLLLELNRDEFKRLNKEKKKKDAVNDDGLSDEEQDEMDEEESDDEKKIEYKEQSFNFQEFVKSFANQKVLYPYLLAFKKYETNSALLNTYIVKMFHRLAYDCLMYCMFFQLSFFRTMQHLFNNHYENDFYSELIRFSKFVIDKFRSVVKTNPNVFIEILYSKTSKEAYVVEHGHEEVKVPKETKGRRGKKSKKTEEEDEFIRQDNSEDDLDTTGEEKWDKLFGKTKETNKLESTRIGLDEKADEDEDADKLLIDEENSGSDEEFKNEVNNLEILTDRPVIDIINRKARQKKLLDLAKEQNSQRESKSIRKRSSVKKKSPKERRKVTKFNDSDEESIKNAESDKEEDNSELNKNKALDLSDNENDREETVKNSVKRKKIDFSDSDNEDEPVKSKEIDSNEANKIDETVKASGKRKVIESSDSENEDEPVKDKEIDSNKTDKIDETVKASGKRKIIESSDSENEDEPVKDKEIDSNEADKIEETVKASGKRKVIDSSDSEEDEPVKKINSKKRKLIESDNEDENSNDNHKENNPSNRYGKIESSDEEGDSEVKSNKKRRKVIDSDSDDERKDENQDEKENFSSKSNLDRSKIDNAIEI